MTRINVFIIGIQGRMGNALIKLMHDNNLAASAKCFSDVVGGVDRGDHAQEGDIPIFTRLKDGHFFLTKQGKGIDFIVDFSSPEASLSALSEADDLGMKAPFIIGTTGYSLAEEESILKFSKRFPIVKAGNFSLGINVLLKLIQQTLFYLKDDYDIEIIEHHHNQKKDAPSGTAKMLLSQIQDAEKFSEYAVVTKREGNIGKRNQREIGVFALRGGGVVGEHQVYFFSENDKIVLTHTAFNRKAFTSGVIKAIDFLMTKRPAGGLFNMEEILG